MWSLVAGIIGAVAALLLREGIEWWRRPRLGIDFEEVDGHKPYILDQLLGSGIAGKTSKAKVLRISVRNTGRKPSMDCEAKMVIFKVGKKEAFMPLIHWARRDPGVYQTLDQIYAPIHLNKRDEEPLDLLMLRYYPEDAELGPGATIVTVSPREYNFERDVPYYIRVTVYASNTISKPFALKLYWDGTLEGFHKAVQKVEKIEDVQGL